MPTFGHGYKLLVEGLMHDEWGNRAATNAELNARLVQRLSDKILKHDGDLLDVQEYFVEDADVVVVAYGSPVRPAMQAVKQARARGVKAGMLKMRIVWPFPDEAVANIGRTASRILVPELNLGKMAREVRRALDGAARVVSLPKLGGMLHTPADILAAIIEGGYVHAPLG